MSLKKNIILILLAYGFTTGCKSPGTIPSKPKDGWHTLNLGQFSINVPSDWKYKIPGQQEDSFVGQIIGPKVALSFDCSSMGYANHLIQTKGEYLDSRDWWDQSSGLPYWGTEVKILLPDSFQKAKYPNADDIAELTYQNKIVYLPIEIPANIKTQNIQLDSNINYVFKTIWPKTTGKGMTGIYIHSRSSNFNFQMCAKNLTTVDQEMVLEAFKTINFKK